MEQRRSRQVVARLACMDALFISWNDSEKASTCSSERFSKFSTRRSAVLRPTPGKDAIWSTAASINRDGSSMVQIYRGLPIFEQ